MSYHGNIAYISRNRENKITLNGAALNQAVSLAITESGFPEKSIFFDFSEKSGFSGPGGAGRARESPGKPGEAREMPGNAGERPGAPGRAPESSGELRRAPESTGVNLF